MANSRAIKKLYRQWLESDAWQDHLDEIAAAGKSAIGPLFSFLPLDPVLRHRASCAIGKTVAEIARTDLDAAKNICRRFMWHMNEDSGNIGWGIPEAFAETLASNPELAKIYAPILLSYIMDLGHADNYCDHDILRRSCYWAAGRLCQVHPELCKKIRPWLLKGLSDKDQPCQGMAAWALLQLHPTLMDAPALKKLAESANTAPIEYFEGTDLKEDTARHMAEKALEKINTRA